ncbi:MAG: hypothetical protein ACRD2D_12370 [Terriglobales bacterium]
MTLALGAMLSASPAVPAAAASAAVAARQGQMMQNMTPAERAKMSTARLDKAVTLTDDQKPKVQAIYEQEYTDMAKAREAGGDDARTEMRKISSDATAKVKALLTPDQLAKYPAPRGRRGGGSHA